MIQRIQSVYLLVVTILMVVCMCSPVGSIIASTQEISEFGNLCITLPDGTKDYFYHIYDETVTADTKRFEDAMGYVTFHVSTFGSFEASKDASHRHIFDQEDASDGHMAVLGNCTTPTVYYTSCVCGENGTETFHGQTVTNRHNGTATKVIAGASAGEHRVLYICCDAMADEHVPCSGGTATCKDRAWCEMCGAEYGELISEHTYGADGQCTVCYMQKPAIPSVDTDTPLDTDMSLDTDTPLDTDMPLDTDTPLDTDLPLDTDTSSDIDTPSGTDTSSDTDMSMDTTTSPDTNTPADTNAPSDTNKPAAPPSPAGDDTDVIPETKGEVEPDQTATDSKSADDGCGSAISWESAAVVSIVALGMGIISKKRAD